MNINTVSLYNSDSAEIVYTKGEEIIKIKTPDHEEGFGIIVKNDAGSDATVKIKGGNSVLSIGDMAITAKAGKETLINLKNTGRYKNVSGEDAGYIVIEIAGVTASSVSVYAFEL